MNLNKGEKVVYKITNPVSILKTTSTEVIFL